MESAKANSQPGASILNEKALYHVLPWAASHLSPKTKTNRQQVKIRVNSTPVQELNEVLIIQSMVITKSIYLMPERVQIHLIGSKQEVRVVTPPSSLRVVRKIPSTQIVVENIVSVEISVVKNIDGVDNYK